MIRGRYLRWWRWIIRWSPLCASLFPSSSFRRAVSKDSIPLRLFFYQKILFRRMSPVCMKIQLHLSTAFNSSSRFTRICPIVGRHFYRCSKNNCGNEWNVELRVIKARRQWAVLWESEPVVHGKIRSFLFGHQKSTDDWCLFLPLLRAVVGDDHVQ